MNKIKWRVVRDRKTCLSNNYLCVKPSRQPATPLGVKRPWGKKAVGDQRPWGTKGLGGRKALHCRMGGLSWMGGQLWMGGLQRPAKPASPRTYAQNFRPHLKIQRPCRSSYQIPSSVVPNARMSLPTIRPAFA
jgi:hypothetical protein